MQNTENKGYALVTGAGSGLGRAFCLELASRGYQIGATDINLEAAQATLDELQATGGHGFAERLDVADVDAWQNLRQKLQAEWPRLDLLVNNAGITVAGEIGEVPFEDFQRAMAVNFSGVLNGCHTMVPWLRETAPGGHIINIASIFGLIAPPALGAYNASKAAVVALSETLYGELRPIDVGVTVVAPGFFASKLVERGTYVRELERDIALRYMRDAKITAEEVVERTMRAVARRRLYFVHGRKARWYWRLKRWLPASFANLIVCRYRRQLRKNREENKG